MSDDERPLPAAVSDDPEAEVLRQEVECLKQETEELTEFLPASSFETQPERS
jgi:hypothetical protein